MSFGGGEFSTMGNFQPELTPTITSNVVSANTGNVGALYTGATFLPNQCATTTFNALTTPSSFDSIVLGTSNNFCNGVIDQKRFPQQVDTSMPSINEEENR
jgi:hypothetical protein